MIASDPEKTPRRRKTAVVDLIAILSTQPPGRRVVVDGYECGFDDIETVSEIAIVPEANTHPQFFGGEPNTIPNKCGVGRHALAESGDDGIDVAAEIVDGVKQSSWRFLGSRHGDSSLT
jgi:hypothetical protein